MHRIIIAASHAGENDATLNLVREAKATGLRVSILPGILGAVGSSVVFDDLWGVTVLGVPHYGLSRSSSALKRAFDLAGAIPLTILFAPVMALAALLIKLDSRGPVFFRQTRVGRGGDHFSIFKFRTMVDGADAMKHELAEHNEADGLFKIADDPRITRVGKWLRRSCLDELPQLFNVLRGEMSLVGPRPLVVNEDERIKGLDRNRLHLTPGMTGPWQILGSVARAARRDGQARLSLHRELVAVERRQDLAADDSDGARAARAVGHFRGASRLMAPRAQALSPWAQSSVAGHQESPRLVVPNLRIVAIQRRQHRARGAAHRSAHITDL